MTTRPFIYVTSLRRTGSRLIAHELSRWPQTVVLLEPCVARVVAEDLLRDWSFIRGIIERCRWRPVRYEDYCANASERWAIRRFVASPLGESSDGELEYLSEHDRARHGTAVTTRSVSRWRDEPDEALRTEAQEMLVHMADYCEFWGYDPQGPREHFPALRAVGTAS